jgi:uncharacterized protein YggE
MELTKILLITILIVAVLSLLVMIKPETETIKKEFPEYRDFKILSAGDEEQPKYLLNVNGEAKLSADPEKVEVYLGAETDASTAKQSQQNNAEIMQAIRDALKSIGINSKDIETTQYSLTVVQHWDEDTDKYIITGYRTTHIIKIKSSDINKAGDIIDKSVQSGANKVNNVVFSLTDEKIKQMKLEALKKAGLNAKEKADAIANSLGVTIKRVYQASEGYVYYQPYYAQKGVGMVAEAPTEISPGQIEISASLSVSYELA